MRSRFILTSAALAAALSACGGGSGSDFDEGRFSQTCPLLTGGGTTASNSVSASCVDCSVSNQNAAIDGNGNTFATLGMPPNSGGTVTLRGTAQPGVVFAAGSQLGMVHSIAYGQSTGLSISLVTYLDGAQQESFIFNVSGSATSNMTASRPGTVAFTSDQQFDAVELNFTRAGGSGGVNARLHSLCAG